MGGGEGTIPIGRRCQMAIWLGAGGKDPPPPPRPWGCWGALLAAPLARRVRLARCGASARLCVCVVAVAVAAAAAVVVVCLWGFRLPGRPAA